MHHLTSERGVTRRSVLLAGLAGAAVVGTTGFAVEERSVPGRTWLYAHLGLNGPDGRIPHVAPGPLVGGSFRSATRHGARVGWSVAYPPGHAPGSALPVVVVLHGRGGDHTSAFGRQLGLDRFLAAAVHGGAAPFVVASVDGGADTYWHRRASGDDPAAMVADELLPLLGRRGLDVARIGLLGWSMGGYGALHLAGLLGSARVAAVVAESPALWESFGDTAPGAFDSPSDFARNTVFGREALLRGIALRVDCGRGDPFYPAVRDYVGALRPAPDGDFEPGGHTVGYWRRMAPAQIGFLARHLPGS
jgi:S-formylglutathione hydrolase FrmB